MVHLITNHVADMISNRSSTITKFGLDQTGLINYHFNAQGFRGIDSFTQPPDVAFFGCSLVFGIGVPVTDTFASLFPNSHNYGLAGHCYNNHDTLKILQDFLASDLYSHTTKIVVVWHRKDADCLPTFYQELKSHDIKHFFCGNKIGHENCYNAPANLDTDVSGTHPGPRTHKFWYRICKSILAD